jgi:hypothetical protein
MALKRALLLNVGGTLRAQIPEGVPTGVTVSVFDETGAATAIAEQDVTPDGSEVAVAVSDAICDTEAENYRACFSYTFDGDAAQLNVLFDVVRAIIHAPCNAATFFAQYPVLRNRLPRGESSPDGFLARAWETILGEMRKAGKNPNRIIDASAFTQAQAMLAAARIADQIPDSDGAEWPATAARWMRDYRSEMESALSAVWWYDSSSDLKPTRAETNVRKRVVALR